MEAVIACKIINPAAWATRLERRMVPDPCFGAGFLDSIRYEFAPSDPSALQGLKKRFGLQGNSTSIEKAFSERGFIAALSNPAAQKAVAFFAEQLVEEGKYYEARRVIDKTRELIRPDENVVLGLSLLKAQTITDAAARRRYYEQQIAANFADDLFLWHLTRYYLATSFIRERNLSAANDVLLHFSSPWKAYKLPAYAEALKNILKAEVLFWQGNEKEALEFYRGVRKKPAQEEEGGRLTPQIAKKLHASLSVFSRVREAQITRNFGKTPSVTIPQDGLYFDPHSLALLHYTSGEISRTQERFSEAAVHYRQAFRTKHSLEAITRLNDVYWREFESGEAKLDRETAQTIIGGLDDEIAGRRNLDAESPETRNEIIILLLRKLKIAEASSQASAAEEAVRDLLELSDGPAKNLVLFYAAAHPLTSRRFREQAQRRDLTGETVGPRNEVEAGVAQSLFETADAEILLESIKAARRKLVLENGVPPREVFQPLLENAEVAELLAFYAPHAEDLHTELELVLEEINRGRLKFFHGEALNPFRALESCGISSFEFRRDAQKKICLCFNSSEGHRFEVGFNAEFETNITHNPELNRLISLIAMDFFLTLEEGEGYTPCFEKLDFRFFKESELLYDLHLRAGLRSVVDRTPTETEEVLFALEAERNLEPPKPAAAEAQRADEEDQKKQIYRYVILPELNKYGKVILDLSRAASLSPLARLIDKMELLPGEEETSLYLHYGDKTIVVVIKPDGNIEIRDQNRSTATLKVIEEMNEVILDVLAAHFLPDYRRALAGGDFRSQLEQIYYAVQNSARARQRKWDIFCSSTEEERPFTIQAVPGQQHPFDSSFFEVKQEPGNKPDLIPLPAMEIAGAQMAIAGGREIAQIGVIGLHRRREENPPGPERIKEYVQRIILENHKPFRELSEEEREQMDALIRRMAAGDLALDPHRFLLPDRSGSLGISLCREVVAPDESGRQKSYRVYYTYVRPHLKLYGRKKVPARNLAQPLPKMEPLPSPPQKEEPSPTEVKAPTGKISKSARLKQAKLNQATLELFRGLKSRGVDNLAEISRTTGIPLPELSLISEGKRNSRKAIFSALRLLLLKTIGEQRNRERAEALQREEDIAGEEYIEREK